MIRRSEVSGISANRSKYREVFIERAHNLIAEGYDRLDPSSFANTDETSITGELVRVMAEFLESSTSPAWCDHFDVHDDPPENDGQRKGRSRKRVDIRVVWTCRPRFHFRIEAKRLGPNHTVKMYLGADGLGCFVSGMYASDEDDAGMIGYVQSGDLDSWSKKVMKEIRLPDKYKLTDKDNVWTPVNFASGPKCVFASLHDRKNQESIRIYHTLLLLC